MSYILQALQRAEAERKRGTTPGLDTPVLPTGVGEVPASRRWAPWIAAGAAAALGGAVVAWWLWPAAAPALAPVPVAQAPAAQPPVVAPAPAPAPAAVPDRAPAQALPETPIVAAPPEPAAKPEPAAPRRAASAPAAVAQAQPATPAPAVPQTQPQPQPQPAPGAERLPTLQELPPSIRQAMPILNVTGGVHSHEPANRMLIVNGQVLREKAQLGPELVLESIGLKSAVFRFRGTRFEVGY
ncbi:general secretion pathway protein GspB [Azohydromonas aeria]|uniref:general secretion pathway protein GspB n=1 Tax=Azohydromonas aeria TaxID=2590212 RepID=UPI0012F72771|nr:general secretion pathway protein GspB [Azohydromonas aeria]